MSADAKQPPNQCSVALGERHHWVHHKGPHVHMWVVQCSLCHAFNWDDMRAQEADLIADVLGGAS